MKNSFLAQVGSISMERLGAAPHSGEVRGMAEGYAEPREIGRRRMNMTQCFCLRWNRLSATHCAACGRNLEAK
jgi:hypothetical protein